MSKILLIGVNRIKAESVIESNVDDKVLSKIIANVQEIQLKPILGKDLYEAVCIEVTAKANDNSYVIIPATKELIDDYIQPFLIHATVAEFIALNNYKISNKGVQKLNDNSSASANSNEVEYIKNYYDNYVSTYKSNLIKFLKENKLIPTGTDTNITLPAIGWFLEGSQSYSSPVIEPASYILFAEIDPVWTAEKIAYYSKTEVDTLLSGISGTSISATLPISYNSGTGVISISQSSTSTNGYLSSVDWNTFNGKQNALGFTPYNASNPNGYITTSALSSYLLTATAASTYQPIGSYLTGVTSLQVTTALGFTPYNSTNPTGFITASALSTYLVSSTAASTYQPIGSFLTSITSGNITTALGFTPYNATNPSAYISLTALSATSPIFYNNTTGVISSQAATTSLNGYLTSTNWNTFNNKQSAITLTTTGSSGASTFVTNTLNIPSYTLAGLGGISLTALSATTPLNYNNTTGVFTINQSTTSTSGYLSNTDWNTFNGKQDLLNGTGFLKATGSSISYDNSTYLTSTGSAASLTSFPTLNQSTTGNAGTATILQTARTINGVSFNGSSNINIVVPIVVTTATSNYNVSTTDDYILGDATSASITITLPTAIGVTKPFTIKRINSGVNVVNINTTSSQTMDGSTSIAMNIQNQSLSFVSNNANWFIK